MSGLRQAGRLGLGAVLVLASGGCSLSKPEPIPLNGPTPRSILVLPIKPAGPPGGVGPALLATIGSALRGRGYDPVPIALGHSQLEGMGLLPDQSYPVERYAAAAREIGADAFLSIRVEQWDASYAPTLVYLHYDIGYRLWDAGTGDLLWELRSNDQWDWKDDQPVYDTGSDLDSYLEPAKRVNPSSPYRDDVDVARAVQKRSLAYLPVCDVR